MARGSSGEYTRLRQAGLVQASAVVLPAGDCQTSSLPHQHLPGGGHPAPSVMQAMSQESQKQVPFHCEKPPANPRDGTGGGLDFFTA
jgi:hypothetical protein